MLILEIKRKEFIEVLESNNFKYMEDNKEKIIFSKLPIVVDLEELTIRLIWNVTVAAAAYTSGALIDAQSFLEKNNLMVK